MIDWTAVVRERHPEPKDGPREDIPHTVDDGHSDEIARQRRAERRAAKNAATVAGLIAGDNGPRPCLENILRILARPEWDGCLIHDALLCRPVLLRATPAHGAGVYPRWWTDTDDAIVCAWMQREVGLFVSPSALPAAVLATASRHSRHPVLDYLGGLRWDGQQRLDLWLHCLFGVEDTPLTRAFASMFLISAVARVSNPGDKADHMLILEGDQGLKKSSGILALLPRAEWFLDDVGEIGGTGKDAAERLQGKWLVEVPELDALSRAEATRVKAFVSRQVDDFRPAYGRWAQRFPRQCVFLGSTNEDHYLKDASGGRRFWPVRCTKIDLDGIRAQRDQLWAEALARYEDGGQWWLSEEIEALAREAQDDRYDADIWHERIEEYLIGQSEVTVAGVLSAIGIEPKAQDPSDERRAAKVLRRLRWRRHQRRDPDGGRRRWVYTKENLP